MLNLIRTSGLSGPSSVAADLTPGDGLTDPQYRSDFPRNIAPAWFAWKDDLAENGLRFNFEYLMLGQHSNADLGTGEAASGFARFYGTWQATVNGSLTFKIEDRHAFTDVAPQFLGLDGGAVAITGTAFNDNGALLTNLFWTQRAPDRSWTFQIGQIDVTDFLDIYGAISPYTSFQNLAFNTNPTINAPNAGLGMAGGLGFGENFYVVASVADANADPSEPGFDVFEEGDLFKSIEIGYTSGFDRIYFDNIHLTLWHGDADKETGRLEDYGAAFSAAWTINNTWLPFFRAGISQGTAALYERSVSTGVAYLGRNTDGAGIGLTWAEANGVPGTQFTTEAFYRFSISPGLQITPSIQVISQPLLNPDQDNFTLLSLRTRVVF